MGEFDKDHYIQITRREEVTFMGNFIIAHFINRKLDNIGWGVFPKDPAQFEAAILELRHIRKAMWPEYNDAATQTITMAKQ